MKPEDEFWLCEFSLGDETHHLMILQGGKNKGALEAAFVRYADAHKSAFPHLAMKLESLVKVESPEQVDKAKERLREKYPTQLTADQMYPDNPNAMLFAPLNASDTAMMSGRAEEMMIRDMCDGRWPGSF